MKQTWLVVYRDHLLDEVFGWLCHAEQRSEAEEKFWKAMGGEEGCSIQSVTEIAFSFPWQEEHGNGTATNI